MKILCILSFLIFNITTLYGQGVISGYQPELKPYVDFIKDSKISPSEYIINKYDKYDIVVFGERDHREITQYYFIKELINQPGFYKQVGVIYTETGSSNYNDTLNKILRDYSLSEKELNKRLTGVYREISYQAIWEKYNFYYLWLTVYEFNKSHRDFPISIEMTSHPFDWNEITDTAICRIKSDEVEKEYDKSMAEFFLGSFRKMKKNSRNKAFVIMNYPHSLRKWISKKNNVYEDMFGAYINRELPERICYIIVSPYRINDSIILPADGKWEAAFKYCNYPRTGFDFDNSPFGKDTFNVWPNRSGLLSFKDSYDGMVYINPLSKVDHVIGIPGFIDNKFADEYIRRLKIRLLIFRGEEYKTSKRIERIYSNRKRSMSIYDFDKYKNLDKMINRWLTFR